MKVTLYKAQPQTDDKRGPRMQGKTLEGSQWLCRVARENPGCRIAIVGPSAEYVRAIMVNGANGILAAAGKPKPVYRPSARTIMWKNGSVVMTFSAEHPEMLRGVVVEWAWVDYGDTALPLAVAERLASCVDNVSYGVRDSSRFLFSSDVADSKVKSVSIRCSRCGNDSSAFDMGECTFCQGYSSGSKTLATEQLVGVRALLATARKELEQAVAARDYHQAIAVEAYEKHGRSAEALRTLEAQVTSLDEKRRVVERELEAVRDCRGQAWDLANSLKASLDERILWEIRLRRSARQLCVGLALLTGSGTAAAAYWHTLGPWVARAWHSAPGSGTWVWVVACLACVLLGRRWGGPRRRQAVALAPALTRPCTECGQRESEFGGMCAPCDEADYQGRLKRGEACVRCEDLGCPDCTDGIPPINPDPATALADSMLRAIRSKMPGGQ